VWLAKYGKTKTIWESITELVHKQAGVEVSKYTVQKRVEQLLEEGLKAFKGTKSAEIDDFTKILDAIKA
jgi:hypothetical protein